MPPRCSRLKSELERVARGFVGGQLLDLPAALDIDCRSDLMRKAAIGGLVVAMSLAPVTVLGQQPSMGLWIGTWKRNVARSSYSPGPSPTTEQTVRMELVNGLLQVTEDGFNAERQPTRVSYVVKFDGTEQPVDAAQALTRTYRWIDERRFEGVNKVRREETTMVEYALAADGRTYTLTTTGITAQGQLVHHVVVYERQGAQ
jgi:hypothetical protein